MSRTPLHHKLDMYDAYEEVHVESDNVKNTSFSTIIGTFQIYVVQQGDSNALPTFQRSMTRILRKYIGKFVHVYLDDI